jgi:hypothetical protein
MPPAPHDLPDLPSDEVLRDHGMAVGDLGQTGGDDRILVLACGALAREIIALIRLNHWDNVDLQCLTAILHAYPERIVPETRKVLDQVQGYTRIFLAYADCGTGGGLQSLCEDYGVQMIRGPHCYAFFDGLAQFEARDEIDAFYLTDFLARQVDAFVWKPLGLDRHPELLSMYFGHYRRLVYLAQTEDAVLTRQAQAAADRMGLTFERRFTGYGELADALAGAVSGDVSGTVI